MYENEGKTPKEISAELNFSYPKVNYVIFCSRYYGKIIKSRGSIKGHTKGFIPKKIKDAMDRLSKKISTETTGKGVGKPKISTSTSIAAIKTLVDTLVNTLVDAKTAKIKTQYEKEFAALKKKIQQAVK